MGKLEKLTKEQEELMTVVRDEWIDIALHKETDKEEAEAGVKWMYHASGLEEPEVVFVDGPNDFVEKFDASVWSSVWSSVEDSVRSSVWSSVGDSVRSSVRSSVGDSVWSSVWSSVGDSVRSSVRSSVGDSVRSSVWASVRASVGDSVLASVLASVRASVSWTSLAYDSDWAALCDYYMRIGVVKNESAEKYLGFLRGGAFFCMFFKKKAFVMSTPKHVSQDENKRLHSTERSALEFLDGTELFMLRGVKFEREWWEKIVKDEMTPEEILAIDNLEHRRIAWEFMDKRKIEGLKGFEVLDEAVDGKGNRMRVVQFEHPDAGRIRYYNCFCPTTMREYYLGTEEEACEKAKARSFGFEEVEFIDEW